MRSDTSAPLKAVKTAALCIILSSAGLTSVYGIRSLVAARYPYVDLSRHTSSSDAWVSPPARSNDDLRFAVATMVSPESTFSTYRRLVERICRDVELGEAFIVRPSYAEVRKALEQGNVTVAFVCTGTYVNSMDSGRVKLLVQPEFEEGLEYRCIIIVPAGSDAGAMKDMQGKVMAFTDPESNTGCIVPTVALTDMGHDPSTFFKKVVFTGSHDRSIRAVAAFAVDAASVDALIWESMLRENPSLADRARVIWQSAPFGPPPIVVPTDIDASLEEALRTAFLKLDKDSEGKEILAAIGVQRFILPRPEAYRSAEATYRRFRQRGGVAWR